MIKESAFNCRQGQESCLSNSSLTALSLYGMLLRMALRGPPGVTWLLGEMEVVEQSSNSRFRCSSTRLTKREQYLQRQKAKNRKGLNSIRSRSRRRLSPQPIISLMNTLSIYLECNVSLKCQSHVSLASRFCVRADRILSSSCSSLKGLSRKATAPPCIAWRRDSLFP